MPENSHLVCPTCGSDSTVHPDGSVRCASCGTTVAAPRTLCPQCLHIAESGAETCAACGAEVTTACPGCGRPNWAGARQCVECGRELTALDHAFRSFQQSYTERVENSRNQMPALRRKEEEGSRRRMQELSDIDRRRLLAEAEKERNRKRKELRTVRILTGVVVSFFILIILLAVLVTR
jgi:hypothetical protein